MDKSLEGFPGNLLGPKPVEWKGMPPIGVPMNPEISDLDKIGAVCWRLATYLSEQERALAKLRERQDDEIKSVQDKHIDLGYAITNWSSLSDAFTARLVHFNNACTKLQNTRAEHDQLKVEIANATRQLKTAKEQWHQLTDKGL